MLLEYAGASDELVGAAGDHSTLHSVIFRAAHSADGRTFPGGGVTDDVVAVVATRIRATPLAPVAAELLRSCLARSMDAAMYWQEPDDEDRLAAAPVVVGALRGVADHLADALAMSWWSGASGDAERWAVAFGDAQPDRPAQSPWTTLRAHRDALRRQEERARRDRPSDPAAAFSAAWWSTPPGELIYTTGALPDGSPAGVWFVEDSHDATTARCRLVSAPERARVYEIDDASAWAELCRRYPIEVTAQKRHDWYRATGRNGRWVISDWAGVADDYDAVHLTLAAYLSAAGTAIKVSDDSASVIAAWTPNLTVWFTDAVRYQGTPVLWTCPGTGLINGWKRAETHP